MSKRYLMLALTMFLVSFLSACGNEAQLAAWKMIDDGALVVDVRTPGEFNSGHLPGAKLIPVNQVSTRISEFGEDKTRPIVVYCQSGGRSGNAESILKANGYTNVVNGGGYNALMSARSDMKKSGV